MRMDRIEVVLFFVNHFLFQQSGSGGETLQLVHQLLEAVA